LLFDVIYQIPFKVTFLLKFARQFFGKAMKIKKEESLFGAFFQMLISLKSLG